MGGNSSKSKIPEQPAAVSPKKAKIEITSIDRTILDLKNTRDKLQQYRTRLLIEDEKLMIKVKQAKTENKIPYALQLLKLHHYKQQQYEQCNAQLINILQMVQTIDSTKNDIHIVSAMTAGKDALRQLQNEISIDQIMDLMEEIQEQNQTEQEISNVIQQNLPNLLTNSMMMIQETDDELMAELDALQQQQQPEDTNTTVTVLPDDLPTAPTHKLPDLVVVTPSISTTTTTATTNANTTTVLEERIAVLG